MSTYSQASQRPASTRPAHVAVIGGGFTGMVCALSLLEQGYEVTVLEAHGQLGGLTETFNYGAFYWDRFYHCILTSDTHLLGLLDRLGLGGELRWTTTEVGCYAHGQLYKLTGARDLLLFPHLSPWNKLRLALATLYVSRLRDGSRLEHLPLGSWTCRLFGKRAYKEIWEPLFRCKLGEMRHDASAAFLWGTLRRLASTRDSGPAKQERLGYVRGGYKTVFRSLAAKVEELGATVLTGTPVIALRRGQNRVEVETAPGQLSFDAAILTVPNQSIARCLEIEDPAVAKSYRARLARVAYLGIICVVLVLRQKLSPYYVTNITEQVPFTGIIEMTNLIEGNEETAGLHLVYLPRYTSPHDPLFSSSDHEIYATFQADLLRLHPQLREDCIVSRFVFRERAVQPVPTLEYSSFAPPVRTPVPMVYVANTAQIVNNTLNNNVMTSIAERACQGVAGQLPNRVPVNSKRMHPDDATAFGAESDGGVTHWLGEASREMGFVKGGTLL